MMSPFQATCRFFPLVVSITPRWSVHRARCERFSTSETNWTSAFVPLVASQSFWKDFRPHTMWRISHTVLADLFLTRSPYTLLRGFPTIPLVLLLPRVSPFLSSSSSHISIISKKNGTPAAVIINNFNEREIITFESSFLATSRDCDWIVRRSDYTKKLDSVVRSGISPCCKLKLHRSARK